MRDRSLRGGWAVVTSGGDEAVERSVKQVIYSSETLDTVIGSAGVHLAGEDDQADWRDVAGWPRTIDVNLNGSVPRLQAGNTSAIRERRGVGVCTGSPIVGCAHR